MREANVSVAAMYLWNAPYKFTQYSSVIQRAIATHIVPKPLPLPYWQTPFLPFTGYIWCYVISSFLICALTLFFVNVCQTIINDDVSGYKAFGLFDSIYAVFKMCLFQCITININFLSNVTIFTTILGSAFIIGHLYTGELFYKYSFGPNGPNVGEVMPLIVFLIFFVKETYLLFVLTGGLSSVMTIPRYESQIDTVESLVNSKWLWGGTSTIW